MEGKKILVVDDEFTIRYLVEHQLKRHGFESIMAKDGPGALEAARKHQPDLIVLDIMMPNMSGFDVCRQLKADPKSAKIPIIFLTALSNKNDKLRAFEMGADDYLTKPFQADEFIAHITAILRRRSGPAASAASQPAKQENGRIAAFYSPKGGVGVSTLAVQMGEALALREGLQVVLIDLALPLGGLAVMLKLYSARHILNLLSNSSESPPLSLKEIMFFSQRHRANLHIIPAPGYYINPQEKPSTERLKQLLGLLKTNGYYILLDLNSALTPITFTALQCADKGFILTSGQELSNKNLDTFLSAAPKLGLNAQRLLPVINELHGPADNAKLTRVPVARIPHVSERSRTRLWLQEQGLSKLVSVLLT